MSTEALLLVLAGALCHAVWNLFAKRAAGGLAFVWLFGLVSLGAALPLALLAWQQTPQALGISAWAAISASALVHVVYSLILQKGYQRADFSVVYPVARGTGPLFAVFGSTIILAEMPSASGWLGIGAVVSGIFLISGISLRRGAGTPRRSAGVFWGGLTGLSIASYTLIDGWAIKVLQLNPVLYYTLGLGLRAAVLAPQAMSNRTELAGQWRDHRVAVLAVGVLSPLAYLLVLYALRLAPLSYVAPVREISMLLAVLFGAWFLRETLRPAHLAGTVFLLAGVAILAQA